MSSPNRTEKELPTDGQEEMGENAECAEADSQPVAVSTQRTSSPDVKHKKGRLVSQLKSPQRANPRISGGSLTGRKKYDEQKVTNMNSLETMQIPAAELHVHSMEHEADPGMVHKIGQDIEAPSHLSRLEEEEEQLRQALAASNNEVHPGAFAVTPAGRGEDEGRRENMLVDHSNDFQLESSDQPEPSYHHVLSAEKVDEEEERKRLQEAMEEGRQQVLQNLRKRCLLLLAMFLVAIIIVVVPIIIINRKDENSTSPTDSLAASLPSEGHHSSLTIATTTLFPSMVPSSSPTDRPENFFCSDAYPVFMDGTVWNGSLVDRERDGMNKSDYDSYVWCSSSRLSSFLIGSDPVYWYRLRGNGLVAAARLCGDPVHYMFVYSVCVTWEKSDCAVDTAMPFSPDCVKYWWETEPGKEYYMLIGTPENNPVGNYSFMLSSNDHCSNAFEIIADNTRHLTSTEFATEENFDTSCGNLEGKGVWYSVNGTGKTMIFNTCENTNMESQISVYIGLCEDLQCITASISSGIGECHYQSSASWLSVLGQMYFIRVSSAQNGSFFASLSMTESFDICDGAELLLLDDSSVVHRGSTLAATNTGDAEYFIDQSSFFLQKYCNEPFQPYSESPGVWYKVIGSNDTISIDSCSNLTGFQPVILIFEGSCRKENLTCAPANYTPCTSSNGDDYVGTMVNWYAEANHTYYIFVFGDEKTEKGDFVLNFTVN